MVMMVQQGGLAMRMEVFLLFFSIILLVQCTQKESFEKPPLVKVEVVDDNYFGKKISGNFNYGWYE